MSKLYNGKWDGIWDKPKYQMIRDKIENAFKGIEFIEETHQYFYKGIELIPTSNVCHAFRLGFDEDSQAERCSLKYFNDPNNKYYQMTKEEILESWHANSKRATDHGTKIHLFGENCAYFMMKRYDRLTEEFKCRIKKEPDGKEYVESAEPKEEAIVRFWNDLPVSIVPILFEVQMFDLSWGVSGTADLLFVYDPHIESDNNYEELRTRLYLMDYKTNADLYKSFGNMLSPFDELPDNDLGGYKIQAGIYSHFIMNLGFEFVARALIWLKDTGEYEKVKMESFTGILRNYLKLHTVKELLNNHK